MSELRDELRYETQAAYGYYCNYASSRFVQPRPYYEFANEYAKGLSVKEFFRLAHEVPKLKEE